ncbi:GMP/IMP nucleotidase [Neiella marina]|uniref:GMP/IMP nucleotidase n=1 Tax=Neiella holothuriorum TaxID=2870530 RepID=A0ABS7EG06_9GAMM|nr:GMP/IMP nucleotidase [Neiella holothuriorum]MBW8191267.1 GMP/IMP nucleotidase [Neiella holothuriorum]
MPQWSAINTVLLDMDGTLLDLYFDNHFWLEFMPRCYAKQQNISEQQALTYLKAEYQALQGKLEWYCLDYWNQRLGLDLMALKRQIAHLIQMRTDTEPFLDALKASGRRVILLTNAHPDSLALKIEHTRLDEHIDVLLSSHQYGAPKEQQRLWQDVVADQQIDPASTLFVDDSLSVLRSAKRFGIGHLLAVTNPDSRQPNRIIEEFESVSDFTTLLDDISQ